MRKEYKFLMNGLEVSKFLTHYKNELTVLHKPNFINSFYYDTKDFYIYKTSLLRDINKFKFRIREYNNSKTYQNEIKISHHQKLKFKSKKFEVEELPKSVNFKNYKLELKSKVSYYRKYYKFFNSRLTIDTKINYSMLNQNLKYDEKHIVIELKLFNNASVDIERNFPSNAVKFSKFENSISHLYFPESLI